MAIGEAGTFPSALAATNEWFPKRERALAIGIFNAGSNVGAIVTPLVVPIIAVTFGWRWAFVATGALTALWIVAWLGFYRRPREHPRVTTEELAWIESEPMEAQRPVKWRTLLRLRQTWAYMAGRFLIDPVWWTFLFWLPDFINRQYHVKMLDFGPPLVAVYILADVGSVAGGYLSPALMRFAGVRLILARKLTVLTGAVLMIGPACIAFASNAYWAIALFCFGGSAALELARTGADLDAVVTFHAGLGTTDGAKAGTFKPAVLVLNGAEDGSVTVEDKTKFADEMRGAKADWQFVDFGGAVHCFSEREADRPPGCVYHEAAAKRGYAMMNDLFAEKFAN